MKPYKVKDDLWFYPVQSKNNPDFNGFYFQYPSLHPGEFVPNDIHEGSPYYGFVNSTIFCVNQTYVDKMKSLGFNRVVNINDFQDDIWQLNNNVYTVKLQLRQQAWASQFGYVFSLSFNGYDFFETLGNFPQSGIGGVAIYAPSIPNYSNGEITGYSANKFTLFEKGTDGIVVASPTFSSFYSLTSERYIKLWKDVIEAPPETPKDTIRIYKNIYLQNGAKITEIENSEESKEPLPPAHQVNGDLWVLPCRQVLDDGTEEPADIYYQYPFKDHRYYDYNNDPFEVNDVSEYNDPTFSQCTVFTGMVKQYYGWNGLRLNSVKLRIKDTVVSLDGYSAHYSTSLRAKRPTDTNYHVIARYPSMQMRVSGSTLFVKLSDTVICGSAYDGAINSDGSVSKARLSKDEITIPDDDESRDFYNWLFNDVYTAMPKLSGLKIHKNIILMNGSKIYNEDGTEYKIQS